MMYSNLDEAWGIGSNAMFASTIPPSSLSIEPSYNYAPPKIKQPSYQASAPIGENSVSNQVMDHDSLVTDSIDKLNTNSINNVSHTPFCIHSPPIHTSNAAMNQDSAKDGTNDSANPGARDNNVNKTTNTNTTNTNTTNTNTTNTTNVNNTNTNTTNTTNTTNVNNTNTTNTTNNNTQEQVDMNRQENYRTNVQKSNSSTSLQSGQSGGSNIYMDKKGTYMSSDPQRNDHKNACDEILEKILDLNCSECHAKINKMLNNTSSLVSRPLVTRPLHDGRGGGMEWSFEPQQQSQPMVSNYNSMMYRQPFSPAVNHPNQPDQPDQPDRHGLKIMWGGESNNGPNSPYIAPYVIMSHEILEIIKGIVVGFILILVVHMILNRHNDSFA
jgi:hypothetical protein